MLRRLQRGGPGLRGAYYLHGGTDGEAAAVSRLFFPALGEGRSCSSFLRPKMQGSSCLSLTFCRCNGVWRDQGPLSDSHFISDRHSRTQIKAGRRVLRLVVLRNGRVRPALYTV